ncbi:MAG: MFS transporter, partial [Spirochaetaceae bacterium]
DQASSLGIVVVAAGIANVISSPFWGRFSDRSSRGMMIAVALLGIVNIGLMLSFQFWPDAIRTVYGFSLLLMIQVIAHAGARLSRKTYLLDFAPEKERPLYVSLSNTMIGGFTLVAAALGTIATIWSVEGMLITYSLLLAGAALLGTRLKGA